jgi:hypothetical protein
MRILFYLPVVTPWWFDNILVPMLRSLHDSAELHVMVAPMWRNTGLTPAQLAPLGDLDRIGWHVIDADDPALFRTDGAAVEGLLDLVAEIAPDITLVRSADFETPKRFPGTVRYIMEGAAPPFATDQRWSVFEPLPFAHGCIDPTQDAFADRCAALMDQAGIMPGLALVEKLESGWRDALGLPYARPVVAVPLHYEHEENFFLAHASHPDSIALLSALDDALDPEVVLAVCDHPLNIRHTDRSMLNAFVEARPERMTLCDIGTTAARPTHILSAMADAVVMDLSKSWSLAAWHGTPLIATGTTRCAEWLGATALGDLAGKPFAASALTVPDPAAARRWFAWHLLGRVVDSYRVDLDLLIARVNGTSTDAMFHDTIAMLRGTMKEAA